VISTDRRRHLEPNIALVTAQQMVIAQLEEDQHIDIISTNDAELDTHNHEIKPDTRSGHRSV
jgi:hypothetical protein